ncbi:MAG: MFS transporter [Candidatus Bathyarchaeia archaeon]
MQPKPNPWILFFLSGVGFLVALGFSLIVPVLPLYAKSFGATNLQIGAIVSGFAVARMAFSMPAGFFADRFSSRNLIVLGLVIVSAASVVVALAESYELILLGRVVSGFGSAFYMTTSVTLLAHITSRGSRGRSMSIYDAIQRVGFIVGPGLGGFFSFTMGLNVPFFVYAVVLGVAAVIAYIGLNIPAQNQGKQKQNFSEAFRLYRNRSFLAVNLATFGLFFVMIGLNLTVLPLFAFANLGLNELEYGLIFTTYAAFYTASSLPAGFLSDRFGRKPFMMLSLLAASAIVFFIPQSNDTFQFTFILILYGLAMGLTGHVAAWISDLAPIGKIGMAIGSYRTVNDLGVVAGPIILTSLSSGGLGISEMPFYFSSAILLFFGLILIKARDPVAKRSIMHDRQTAGTQL